MSGIQYLITRWKRTGKILGGSLLLLFLMGGIAKSYAGKISGKVADADGNPLPGVNVLVKNTGLGAATDDNGYYFVLNVPNGSYDVEASMIGYQRVVKSNVEITQNLTTHLNFTLSRSSVKGQQVVVESYRKPAIQKDVTFKNQAISNTEVRDMPVNNVSDVIQKQAGISRAIQTTPVSSRPVFGQFATTPNDGLHFRGGRSNETLYLFDGVNVKDGIWGDFAMDAIGELTYQYMETLTGTFPPQYGDAMSGVFSLSPRDNPVGSMKYFVKAFTDNTGLDQYSNNTNNFEAMFSIPLRKNLTFMSSARRYSTDGYIFGYIYPNYRNSEGTDKSGTPKKVPMQFEDNEFAFSKLIWKATDDIKISAGGYGTRSHRGTYNHYFKYNPYGNPTAKTHSELGYIKYNQVLSNRTFFTISLARFNRYFKSNVYNTPQDYAVIPQNGTGEFSYSGEDWVYFRSHFFRNEFAFDLTSQVSNLHKINLGFTGDWLETFLTRKNPDGFSNIEYYNLHPKKYSGYLMDKMEFEDMGMIVNVGLRYEYVDTHRKFTAHLNNPDDTLKWVPPESYVSPRLGISYPISDVAAFRFGYGHYYQFPAFYKVYQGLNQTYDKWRVDVTQVQGAIARGDIKPEHTVNYEAGVQSKLTDNISMDVTGFYRKTSNLIGIVVKSDIHDRRFPVFDNINFATVKGLEITLHKRMSNNFSGFINYTYSKTLVSSSYIFQRPQDLSVTHPADWDQPHIVQFNLTFRLPHHWGTAVSGGIESGLPYTYSQFDINGERGPTMYHLDWLLYKNISMLGFHQRIFLQVLNVPNHKNVYWVYADSGIPGVDANPATSNDYTNNPSEWGPGRRIQVGISLWN